MTHERFSSSRDGIAICALAIFSTGCAGAPLTAPPPSDAADRPAKIVAASDVVWEHLNPARGDQSPRAATLWGDRNGRGPTGFLVRFVDGFSSPPHIHNVSYRGVVIDGLVHNDDPNAESMWMPTGSFWTQPLGSAHITAAKGTETIAYIEIDDGPYLVRPVEDAAPSEDHPVNVHASNIVWVRASEIARGASVDASNAAGGPRIAFLWGSPHDEGPSGILVMLAARSAAVIRSPGSTVRAVVIQGTAEYRGAGGSSPPSMPPGSFVGSNGPMNVACESGRDCIFYVRADARIDVVRR